MAEGKGGAEKKMTDGELGRESGDWAEWAERREECARMGRWNEAKHRVPRRNPLGGAGWLAFPPSGGKKQSDHLALRRAGWWRGKEVGKGGHSVHTA